MERKGGHIAGQGELVTKNPKQRRKVAVEAAGPRWHRVEMNRRQFAENSRRLGKKSESQRDLQCRFCEAVKFGRRGEPFKCCLSKESLPRMGG